MTGLKKVETVSTNSGIEKQCIQETSSKLFMSGCRVVDDLLTTMSDLQRSGTLQLLSSTCTRKTTDTQPRGASSLHIGPYCPVHQDNIAAVHLSLTIRLAVLLFLQYHLI